MKTGVKQIVVALCGAFFCNFTITLAQTAPPQPRLAVLGLRAESDTLKREAAKLNAQLHTEFQRLQLFACVPPVADMHTPQSTGPHNGNDWSAAIAAGRALSANVVAFGSLQKNGHAYAIELYLMHVASGQIVEHVREDFFGDLDALEHHMSGIVRKLIGMAAPDAGPASFAGTFEGSLIDREAPSSI